MLHAGERARGPSLIARVVALTWLRVALLGAEVRAGSPCLACIGLITLTLALQTIIISIPGHFRPAPDAFIAVLVCAATLGSLAATLFATLSLRQLLSLRYRQVLAVGALGGLLVLAVIGTARGLDGISIRAQGAPYNNDGAVMDLYSAQQVLHGHNPYLKTNIVPALANIDAPCSTTTPLMRGQFSGAMAYPSDAAIQQVCLNVLRHRSNPGLPIPPEFESKYNYPAGSFLFILPFVWAGFHDLRFLYALAVLLMGVYLWMRMPRSLRLLVPLLLLADAPVVIATTGGQPDPIYGLLLLIGYAEWRKRSVSPLFLGLAVGTKQLAWFFVPFYLVIVFRHFGWREAIRRSSIVILIFLLMNGPFIVQGPPAYLASVGAPARDPMFPLGIGIIALFVSSVWPMLPKVAFTVAEIAAWAAGTSAMALLRSLPPAAGIVLSGLPLFFAWRSLTSYFYLIPLITLAVVLADGRQRLPESAQA